MNFPKIFIDPEPEKEPEPEKKIDPKVRKWQRIALVMLASWLFFGPVLNQVWYMTKIDVLYWISRILTYSIMLISGIYFLAVLLLNVRFFYSKISDEESRDEYLGYIFYMLLYGLPLTIIGGFLLVSQLLLIVNGCADLDIACPY